MLGESREKPAHSRLLSIQFSTLSSLYGFLLRARTRFVTGTLSSSLKKRSPSFGKAIKFLRDLVGRSQEQVSDISELDVTLISAIENGKANPTLKSLKGLAKALDVPPSHLLILEDVFERQRKREAKT